MASSSTIPALAERADIHKSCKSIETLLNILSEYCEAAGAVVSLQKKLAKALKDAASSKAAAEIPSNVMLASASVFESLLDVDSKFSRTLDKEYDMISDEVKKSFKKLTKEEKAHDEKMSAANAKIKQAGQIYEKKAKKKAFDANEEHSRYINLISALGPEISQDKYNHALGMSQRHTTMIYNVASCLARLADLEWQRSCECVRRFSPTIGPLGSLRALCEGGWTGPIPPDLPDTPNDVPTPQAEGNTKLGSIEEIAEHQPASTDVTPNLTSPNGSDSLAANKHAQILATPIPFPSLTTASADTLQPPAAPFVDPNTGSVRSLSAFPFPPTHFPLPPLQQQQQQPTSPLPTRSSTSLLDFPSSSPLADSPISALDDLSSHGPGHAQQSNFAQSSAPSPAQQNYDDQFTVPEIPEAKPDHAPTRETVTRRTLPHRSQTALPADSPPHNNPHSPPLHPVEIKPLNLRHRDRDSPTTKEFGVLGNNRPSPTKSRTMDNFKYPRSIERTDTGTSTSGSIVAAMRGRYDNNSGSTSPPRDLPRLPLNVSHMSARYQNNEFQRSPNSRTNSPPVSRQQSLPLLDAAARQVRDSYTTGPNSSEEEWRRQQRENELAEISRKEKEQELRDQEAELEARARELEKDRARLQALRAGGEERDTGHIRENIDGNGTENRPGQLLGLHSRERRVSLRRQPLRPLSKTDLNEENERPPSSPNHVPSSSRTVPLRPRTQESYIQHLVPPPSANNLHTPPATLQPIHSPKPSHPPSPILRPEGHLQESRTSNRSRDDVSHSYTSTSTSSIHAPFCGCEKCSITKYREQSVDQHNAQNESRRSEKSKLGTGWIRRLSMPVSNMKRHQSNNSLGVANSHALGSGTNKGSGLFSLDSKKSMSMSTTGLSVDEDGKLGRPGGMALGRRNYDFAGTNNRSMTNLNLR